MNWNDTPNVFVAFLDIMGFKDRLKRYTHEEVKDMFKSLRPVLRDLEAKAKEKEVISKEVTKKGRSFLASYFNNPDIRVIAGSDILPISFSDSIILISSNDTYESAQAILQRVNLILYAAIDSGVPIKGAIAYGEMTADTKESLYFGQPLIDAVELQEELKLYGVVLHHTFEKRLNDPDFIKSHNVKELRDKYITKYPVPMKSGKITHYIVNWIEIFEILGDNTLYAVNGLYTNVSGAPRIYVDNTLEFIRWIEEKKAELGNKKKP